jgi:hypothetical protein
MKELSRRLDAIEAKMPARDTGPIVVRLRSAPGLSFTRRGLSDWVRNTPPFPGAAHPIRGLLASFYLDAMTSQGDADAEQAHEAAERAVMAVDEAIVRGEIGRVADEIREWERRLPTGISGTMLTR